jgi:alpha-1,2-mannosyltransferase
MTDLLPTTAELGTPAPARTLLGALRGGRWLDRRRIVGYCVALLIFEIVAFCIAVVATHGWVVPLNEPTTTDFASFYAAGVLANAGTPGLAYDSVRHFAVEHQVTGGVNYQFFFYPPVYLLVCAGLARLPYMVAFILFEAATAALYLVVARGILGEKNGAASLVLLAFPAVFWTIGLGQNALLTASLFGAATLLVDRRPVLAGLLFGALCYKPHVGLLIPLALAGGGRWRCFAAAAASACLLVLLSLALFGVQTWIDFLAAVTNAPDTYQSGRISLFAMISPFGAVRLMGGGPMLAYGAQLAAVAAVAGIVAVIWRLRLSEPVRAAVLAAATPIAMPVALIYDMMLAGIAMAWLARAARATGFLPWEKTALVGLFAGALLSFTLSGPLHIPFALISLLGLLAVIVARARWELARARDPA